MKLFVGLGNPEIKYINTRHNVGYLFIDQIRKKKPQIRNGIFLKTNTFMNDSGVSVKDHLLKNKANAENLYIIHDDLDLPLGAWKMQYAKGPKDNGGINSIEQFLGTKDFWRIRVGIDNRNPETPGGKSTSGEEYVLEPFPESERKIIDGVFDEICKKLVTL